jgi:hypothetical protein
MKFPVVSRRPWLAAAAGVLAAVAVAHPVRAADAPVHSKDVVRVPQPVPAADDPWAPDVDYDTPRSEFAGFPLIGGDSDVGFEVGGVLTITRLQDGVRPYLRNMDLVLAASFKQGPSGVELVQQSYVWNWDLPALMDGRLRLNPLVAFQRTINAGYFGLGNASSSSRPAGATGDPGRYFQFIQDEARMRELARIHASGPWDVVVGPTFRVVEPGIYPGSRLAMDVATATPDGSPTVEGARHLGLASAIVGAIYDTRDDEVYARRGQFHQASIKFVEGFPLDAGVRYGQASAMLSSFTPVGRALVLAVRGVLDVEFGRVPFYDLLTGGPFIALEMPGGAQGVRGVPVGRYLGPIKAIANAELRSLAPAVHFLGGSFRFGGDVFADTGRVWSDASLSSPLDGSGLGLKYGVGGGAYLLWGQAAIFRVDVAYSPDAVAENPGFPLGIYVADGTMF